VSDAPEDHVARYRRYRQRGWWRPELLDELVLGSRKNSSQHVALVGDGRHLTRAQLDSAASACASQLADSGIRPGENVVVQLPNVVQFVTLVLGLIKLGVRPVLTLPALREHELDPVLAAVQPVALAVPARQRRFDHLAMAERLRSRHPSVRTLLVLGRPEEIDPARGHLNLDHLTSQQQTGSLTVSDARHPADVALFLLSSGTTGAPKAIPRTHEAFGHVIRTSAAVSGLKSDSAYLAVMPATHSFTFGHPGILGALSTGGRVVLGAPDAPAAALAMIERQRVTHCALAPAVALQWLSIAHTRDFDLSSLKVLQVGGARLDERTAARLTEMFGCHVQQVYGMSEGLLNFTRLDDPVDVVFSTQGRPSSPGDETLVVNELGEPVLDGEVGELWTRGPSVISAYHRGSGGSASFAPDGYYRSGDLVYVHPSGNLVVAGRVKDVINRGGEKIPADELEMLAQSHPEVRSAAAVAMPHPVLGEVVCLYLVGAGNAAPGLREMRRFLEDRGLARFKLPERVVEVDALPLVGVGKLDKVSLRKDIAARLATERNDQPTNA
jgi:2,3-dihydroxybenzoate-AMP ligase